MLAASVRTTGVPSAAAAPYRFECESLATTNAPGTNGLGTVQQGFTETSNVNVVEELVNMIQTQRAYEINSKSVQASDEMLQNVANMKH